MAVRHGRNEKKAFFCRNKAEGGDCDAPNMPYLETRLLDQVADFRWEEYFGDPKHDAERASAAAEVVAAAVAWTQAKSAMTAGALS